LDNRARALIDTGAILAILSKRDPWHSSCASALDQLRIPLITSEAVLAELFHLIKGNRIASETAWSFVLSGGIDVAPMRQDELAAIRMLMDRYADRPMDFADATLVYLAQRADFSIYRIDGKLAFTVLPNARS
jgi:predicted nucleic acid-binding protein